jgi:ABC-type transport system involved in cytochrome bd biosynthesis fused ATPase/permease subunit
MSEMLHNIKMLKLYGWDLWFVGRIRASKDNLDTKEKQLANRDLMIGYGLHCIRCMVPIFTFALTVYFGNTLDLAMIIIAQGYFGQMQWVMNEVPEIYKCTGEALEHYQKLEDFLQLPDI